MVIDLQKIPYYWINLDEHVKNAEDITIQFEKYGITDHTRIPGIRDPKHYVGVGKAHISAMTAAIQRDIFPCVILEDDAMISEYYKQCIKIDDDVQGLYLGTSTAGRVQIQKMNVDFSKIQDMFAAHAIMYITKEYLIAMRNICMNCIHVRDIPWDFGSSALQREFNVWCCNYPYYYQANARESANKWESLTKTVIQ